MRCFRNHGCMEATPHAGHTSIATSALSVVRGNCVTMGAPNALLLRFRCCRSPSHEDMVAWAQNALPGGLPAGAEDLLKEKKESAEQGEGPRGNGVQHSEP